jgi:hypothetical protein
MTQRFNHINHELVSKLISTLMSFNASPEAVNALSLTLSFLQLQLQCISAESLLHLDNLNKHQSDCIQILYVAQTRIKEK